jgi:hypothetical protein
MLCDVGGNDAAARTRDNKTSDGPLEGPVVEIAEDCSSEKDRRDRHIQANMEHSVCHQTIEAFILHLLFPFARPSSPVDRANSNTLSVLGVT